MIDRILRLCCICLCAAPGWLLLRRPWKRKPLAREVVLGCFAVFMCGLGMMVLDGRWDAPGVMLSRAAERLQTGRNINTQPLRVILHQVRTIGQGDSLTLLLGNTLLFMPWGFCLPLLWRRFRPALTMAGMALLLTCTIEFIQLFIERMADVDDLLLNFSGSMAGFGLRQLVRRRFPGLDARLGIR